MFPMFKETWTFFGTHIYIHAYTYTEIPTFTELHSNGKLLREKTVNTKIFRTEVWPCLFTSCVRNPFFFSVCVHVVFQ